MDTPAVLKPRKLWTGKQVGYEAMGQPTCEF
jgi:hypothetical protein